MPDTTTAESLSECTARRRTEVLITRRVMGFHAILQLGSRRFRAG